MSMATAIRDSIVDLSREAVAFVYPAVCVRCGVTLVSGDNGRIHALGGQGRFCGQCHEALRCTVEHACLTCGAPVGPHLKAWGCRHCRKDRFAFEQVIAMGVYERELKQCCLRIKEPSHEPLAAGLTELLWEAHEATLCGAGIDLVVPVPHHWWDRVTRRDLPPVTMARVLARRLSIPVAGHILAKRRRTPAQSSLPPAGRRRNLRDAFRITGGARLDGRTVLLTDDILTTGTTADRAAQLLKQAGAACVVVAVLARGLGQSSGF